MDLLALDLVLLLPEEANERAKAVNAALGAGQPEGFRFDETHVPHLTLVQQFLRRARLPALVENLDRVLRRAAPLSIRVLGIHSQESTVLFLVERTPALQRLHEELMDAVEPLEEPQGAAGAFYTNGEAARERDVAWVGRFRAEASYANFVPHVTLGVGPPPPPLEPFAFTADRVGLFHLGRFCTCRAPLRAWKLLAVP